MKRFLLLTAVWCSFILAWAQQSVPVLHTISSQVKVFADGQESILWYINPRLRPDVYTTSAHRVVFRSETDSLVFDVEKWGCHDFWIVVNNTDSALTRIQWVSGNPMEEPSPQILRRSTGGWLSKEQALFDLNALCYTISEVHPNMFATCGQDRFMIEKARIEAEMPDSMTKLMLYERIAPLVTMLDDGHTNVVFPFNDVFTRTTQRLPLFVETGPDRTLTALRCIDNTIPQGAEILRINGVDAKTMVQAMLPYVSGEREYYRLDRLSGVFPALFQMLYAAEKYQVEYRENGRKKPQTVMLAPATWDEMKLRMSKAEQSRSNMPYDFRILDKEKVAVMDFNSCDNIEGMRHFADSMFTALRTQGIKRLIIDVRNNGGGNSRVGDELLRYIAPEPFCQMEKTLVRVTPVTQKLANGSIPYTGWYYYGMDNRKLIQPLTAAEGHFDGQVWLLIGHHTFSSASSFAWAFKAFHAGKTVGEETGGMGVSFGDYLIYRMPASNLACTISYKRFFLYGADEKNIHGTLPDYPIKADKALDEALRIMAKQRGN